MTLGGDNGGVSDVPQEPVRPEPKERPRRKHRRVVRVGTETTDVSGLPEDERAPRTDNDDRLLRDVPPHWGKR